MHIKITQVGYWIFVGVVLLADAIYPKFWVVLVGVLHDAFNISIPVMAGIGIWKQIRNRLKKDKSDETI